MRRGTILSLVTAGVFLALAAALFEIDFTRIPGLLGGCRIDFLMLAFAAYGLSYAGRALRFRLLLSKGSPRWSSLFGVVALHNLMNMILPARTGELSYLYLAKTRYRVGGAQALASLVTARVLDLVCLMLFFTMGLVYLGTRFEATPSNLMITGLVALGVSGVLLWRLPHLARLGARIVAGLVKRLGLAERRLPALAATKARETASHLEGMRGRAIMIPVFAISAVTWLMTFLACYLILLSFGVVTAAEIPFALSIVGTAALNATSVLPLNSFGNLGTWEAAWAAGYTLVGMDPALAGETGVGVHVIIFGFGLLLGGATWAAFRMCGIPDAPGDRGGDG